jgi:DNA-binding CsgD family transcriptional regulator/PAS domain-containing protein
LDRVHKDIDEPQFTELCGSLYEAAHSPELMTNALDRVRESFGFEAFHQFVIDTQTGAPIKEWANQRITQDDMAQYAQHYFAKDPRPLMAAKAGVGRLFNTRSHYDKRLESQSEIMQDFLRPRGIGHCIGGQLISNENTVAFAAFLDAKDRGAKSEKQVDFMGRLILHLSKSTQLLLELQNLRGRLAVSAQALDASEAAIYTLTGRHRVVSANRKAESLLRQRVILKMTEGSLCVCEPNSMSKWSALLQRVRATGIAESVTLFGRQGGLPIQVQVSASRIFSHGSDALTGAADLLVMVSSVAHRRVASVKQLTELFGLSQAEALLARALAQGMETSEFAESRGIKMTTVRTQSRSSMDKLRVTRMADLIRLVLSVPAVR